MTLVRAPDRAPTSERIALAAIALGALLLLGVALSLAPDPRGFGTHERLGLPPCGLMRIAHVPCPSCGMTTAFAHAVRLEPVAAFRAQPFGLLLALLAGAAALGGPVAAALGTPVFSRFPPLVSRGVALACLGALLASWIYKIIAVRMGLP